MAGACQIETSKITDGTEVRALASAGDLLRSKSLKAGVGQEVAHHFNEALKNRVIYEHEAHQRIEAIFNPGTTNPFVAVLPRAVHQEAILRLKRMATHLT